MRISKRYVEIAALLVTYALFFFVGAYSGQTTMSVEPVSPPDGAKIQYAPVELIVRVTVRGVSVSDAKTRFTIVYSPSDESNTDTVTDGDGFARLLAPLGSGNFTWRVAASRAGYPTMASRWASFSISLSLLVEPLLPSTFILAVSPVTFRARVADMTGNPVESANVTFYVDSTNVGSNQTDRNGLAKLSVPLAEGTHLWFASASKNGQGGISGPTSFVVGQLAYSGQS